MFTKKLKQHWSTPENIVDKNAKKELRDFIENTRIISTDNAKPFLYFKKPFHAKNVNRPDELEQFLVTGDYTKVEEIIKSNSNFEAVVRFILGLYGEFARQQSQLYHLAIGSITVFNNLNKQSRQENYYNTTAKIIDRELWKDYLKFPTEIIFSYLILNKKLNSSIKKSLIKRYISVLASSKLKEASRKTSTQTIFQHLLKSKKWHDKEDKNNISSYIQQSFATDSDILSLFVDKTDQNTYISDQAVSNLINNLTFENISTYPSVISLYKSRIIDKGFIDSLLQKITDSLSQERAENPQFRGEKEVLLSSILAILDSFSKNLRSAQKDSVDKLAVELLEGPRQISLHDNWKLFTLCLLKIKPWTSPQYHPNIKKTLDTFLIHASLQILEKFLEDEEISKEVQEVSGKGLPQILPTLRTDVNRRIVIYKHVPNESKQEIINDLILHTNNKGLDFLNTLKELPNRISTVKLMLSELKKLQPPNRKGGYNWVAANIKTNDEASIKDEVDEQTVAMLKHDDNNIASIGYDVFSKAQFLSKPKRREIAQQVLDWLIQPGKTLSANNRFAFKTVIHAIKNDDLQETPQKDLVYTLFGLLRKDKDRQTLEVAIEAVQELKPVYSKNKQDFDDLLEALKSWPDNENKKVVVDGILTLKPDRVSKIEKDYWKQIESMLQKD